MVICIGLNNLLMKARTSTPFLPVRWVPSLVFLHYYSPQVKVMKMWLNSFWNMEQIRNGVFKIRPLLLACINRHNSTVKLLLEHGANPNTRGEDTPLRWAQEHEDNQLIDMLKSYGAKEQTSGQN